MCQLCDDGNPQRHGRSRRDFLKEPPSPGWPPPGPVSSGPARPRRTATTAAGRHRPARPALRHPRRLRDVDGPERRRLPPGRRPGRGQEDRRHRPESARRQCHGDRRPRPHRHARLHRHAPPSVRDGAAQLPRRRPAAPRHTGRGGINYFQFILLTFAPVYRPQDVFISELFGSLSQLDDGVTTVHDISQIHHSPAHSDAAIQGIMASGRRAAFGYFESAGPVAGNKYPDDASASRSSGSPRPISSST